MSWNGTRHKSYNRSNDKFDFQDWAARDYVDQNLCDEWHRDQYYRYDHIPRMEQIRTMYMCKLLYKLNLKTAETWINDYYW